jgi:hypothetical protein
MTEEAQAFTRAIGGRGDANVVKRAETKPMDGEATAADLAGHLPERVERRLVTGANTEYANAVSSRGTKQLNDAFRTCSRSHALDYSRA